MALSIHSASMVVLTTELPPLTSISNDFSSLSGVMTTDLSPITSNSNDSNSSNVAMASELPPINFTGTSPTANSYSLVSLLAAVVCGSTGVLGNSLVVLVMYFARNQTLGVTNRLIINQSILDLVGSIFLLIYAICNDLGVTASDFGQTGAEIFCRTIENRALMFSVWLSSTLNLAFLAIERHQAITQPFAHKLRFTPMKVNLGCVAVWVLGVSHQLAVATPAAKIIDGACVRRTILPNKASKYTLAIYLFVIQHFIPLLIMIYCYTRIVGVLRARVNHTESHLSKAKRSTLKTLIIVTVCYFACWVANQWIFLLFNLGVTSAGILYGPWGNLSVILVNVNCCINPFVYAASFEAFRRSFKDLFCSRWFGRVDTTTTSPSGNATNSGQVRTVSSNI